MATYKETTRSVSAGCDIELDYQFLLYPPGQSFIDEDAYVDGTVGGTSGHMAWGATWVWSKFTQSSGMLNWTWEIRLTVTANNGHGATNSTTIVVASGTESNSTTSVSKTGTVTGSWSGSGSVDILWDITEAADPSTIEYPTWPRETTLNWYEQSQSGSTQTSTLTLGGTSCTATGTVGATKRTANYTFVATLDGFAQEGASGSGTLTLVKVNTIAPTYATHSHTNNGQTVGNWSVDVTSGPTQTNTAELGASARLRASCDIDGVARAWDGAYPDSLTWRITGYDKTTTGYRDVSGTGSFGASETFDQYDFDSTIITTVGGTSTLSTTLDEVPAQIYAAIHSGLSAAGDDITATRFLFRGWRFDGITVTQDSTKSISGTGNDRTYSPYQGMSGYRYLDVQVKAQSGTNVPGVIEITDYHGNTKTWNVTGATTSYATVTLDLCSPDSWSVSALPATDGKDDPYPRKNTANSTYAGTESVDSAYWGVTSAQRLRVLSGSIDIGTTTLKYTNSDSTYVYSGKNHRIERITKAEVAEVGTTTTYYTRRFWQQDRDGRTEEEGDVWWQKTVGTGDPPVTSYSLDPVTISEFADQINASDDSVVRHPGWTATNVVAYPGSGTCSVSLPPLSSCYLNGGTGYATWLRGGGILAQPATSSGTEFVFGHQITTGSIKAQVLFDKINGNFPPDRNDPFDVNAGTDTGLYLPGGSTLRGIAHGALLDGNGDPKTTGTVNLLLAATAANRGSDSTPDSAGRYYTGTPWGLGEANHDITFGNSTVDVDPLRTSKRSRAWFRDVAAGCVSIDTAANQRVCYGMDVSGTLRLYFAAGPDANLWEEQITTVTGVDCVAIAYDKASDKGRLWLLLETTSGAIQQRYTDDEGATTSVATTIAAAGKNVSVATNPLGKRVIVYTDSSNLYRQIRDAQDNIITAASAIVTGGVADAKTAVTWRLDRWYILYRNSSGAIIEIKSLDDGESFS